MPAELKNVVLQGAAETVLSTLPDNSIDCCVTSPPYWGLRDYGVAGQLGLEPTFAEFLAKLVKIFEQVRRVLKPRGSCWVNMGDCYATGAGRAKNPGSQVGARGGSEGKHRYQTEFPVCQPNRMPQDKLKPKDLVGQPWSLAFAMRDAGWWLREDIVWHKPNPMPESVTDRCTRAHEMIFHFSKSEKYYHDADAIRTECTDLRDLKGTRKAPHGWATDGTEHTAVAHSRRDREGRSKKYSFQREQETAPGQKPQFRTDREDKDYNTGANRRSVWTIATQGYPGAHFATFPTEIPRLCILAGCPPGGMVLDPFGGSGTTGEVAVKLGRHFTLIELNPAYVTLINNRLGLFAPHLAAAGE